MNHPLGLFLAITFTVVNTFAQQPSAAAPLNSRIDSYLSAGSENGFSGAIAVVKNGETIINKGYGLANKDTQTANTPNTIFDIGSNTKQFTATAILKLAEQGKLNLDDPVSKYFKNLPADKQNITIHQLLTHTAGLPDAIGNDFDEITREEFFKQLFATELLHEPGTKYSYSNIGYSVLGRIIEITSEQPYEAFLNQYLFTPAGMKQTGYLLPDWDTTKLAHGYNRNVLETGSPVTRYRASGDISWHLNANGGINASQKDLLLWYKALKGNTILTPESFKKLTTPYISAPEGNYSYGYGWVVRTTNENTLRISHNGSNGTFSHTMIWYPEEDLYIVYATNANSSRVEGLGYEVEKMVLDDSYVPAPIKNNVYAFTIDYIKQYPADHRDELFSLLREEYPEEFSNSSLLNTIGNFLLGRDQHIDWALELFKKNVEIYPQDGNLWDSLGDGYKSNNMTEEAISSYKKAIELGYTTSQSKLNELVSDR
ncbi:serine hydrolase domain-containing protein [Robertkochia flava]|uniref:serine hydrolase domain-containing protein n=1 Tax=Robertkochia flava TaxID=3447986 RepID=UPI001CCDE18C|nr:serine hydrolase domain-containing protein [Robertkochia marina]